MTEWLDSITDQKLRQRVKDNLLVSGGSITSMLMNIDVNDFDIYLNDMDVVKDVTNYYTKGHDFTILDGREKESIKLKYEEEFGDFENQFAIALRTLHEDQIKLFFGNDKGGVAVNQESANDEGKFIPLYFSPNAITLSDKVQIVIRFHGDNEDIHKTFDFIHATNYFTMKEGLVTNKAALESILTMQLRYQGSLYPLTSIIRMKKFIKRNWNISAGEILKIMFQISELNLYDPDVLEEQLIGVDVAYFSKLIEILRGVDNGKLNSHFLNDIIDRVFNSCEEDI
jgi:hypothetical protein